LPHRWKVEEEEEEEEEEKGEREAYAQCGPPL